MFKSTTSSNDSTVISSSSSYFSSSSSSSPFSDLRENNNKSMEEVWKDINITSLPNTPLAHHNHYTNNNNQVNFIKNINNMIHHPTPTTNFRGIILQDFLNCNNPSISTVDHHDNQGSEIHQQQTPVTTLMLTNNEFDPQNYSSAFATLDALGSSSVLVADGGGCGGGGAVLKKRSSEIVDVDRRNKRMIKNRESAARSRARKQAYINELELEVSPFSRRKSQAKETTTTVAGSSAKSASEKAQPNSNTNGSILRDDEEQDKMGHPLFIYSVCYPFCQ